MHIFPDSRPDYFSTYISPGEWKKEVTQLSGIPAGSVPCLTEKGFASAGIVYAVWQKIKGLFGFNDEMDELRISGRILKLLFVGKACGYQGLQPLQAKIDSGHLRVHQAVRNAFQAKTGEEVRNQLIQFYEVNQDGLQPSFWNRLVEKKFKIYRGEDFGDTYLAMAEGTEEFSKALSYYRLAAQLLNIAYTNGCGFPQRLFLSFLNFAKGKSPSSELGEVFLLLAQGFMVEGNAQHACMAFERATQFGGVFSPKLKELHLASLVKVGHWAVHPGQFALAKTLAHQIPSNLQPWETCLYLAEESFREKEYDEAALFYEWAVQNGAALSLDQKERQFVALTRLGRLQEAKEIAHELENRASFSGLAGEGHLRIAEEAFQAKRYDEAAFFFSRAADLTVHQRVLWMRAATYAEEWDVVKKLSSQVPSDVQDPLACLQLAESAFYANRFDEAELFFDRAMRNGVVLSADQKELLFAVLFRLGKFEEAKRLSHEIADRAPFQGILAEAHLQFAKQAFLAKRYEEASLFFSRATDPSPGDQAQWMITAAKTGQFALAESLVETAEVADEAYLLLAENAYVDKRMEDAARFFGLTSTEKTAEEKLHWMIAAAMTGQFDVADELSYGALEPKTQEKKLVQSVYLLLAEKKDANRFYPLAHEQGAELTFRQFGFWLIAAADAGDWEKAEWISRFLPNPIPDKELQAKIAPLYARLGEEKAAGKKFPEAEAFFQLALQNKAALGERQQALSFLASAKCGHFGDAEKLPQIIDDDLKRDVGEALLILAQRKWDSGQVDDAERLFDLAEQNEAPISQHLKALWMIASVNSARFDRAERLFTEIQSLTPKDALRAPLAEAMITLGSHHAAKGEPVQTSFFSYFLGGVSGDAKAIACFARATKLIPEADRRATDRLAESFDSFASRLKTPQAQVGAIYLQLAERMHSYQDFAKADPLYLSATQNQAALSADQTAHWMLAAAKAQNKTTVLNLANQVAGSSLKGALKTTVQDTYLQLATSAYEEKRFEQADLFYQLASRLNATLTLEQKAFWILSAAQMGRPDVAELFADEDFEPLQPAIKREIGAVFLTRAERTSDAKTADLFFQLAHQYRVSFTLSQQILWFSAAVDAKNLPTAERLAGIVEESKPEGSLQKLYLAAMIRLADQFAVSKGGGYLPSWLGGEDSLALGRKAVSYYYRIFTALGESDPLRMEILIKISQTAHFLKAGELEIALPFHSSNPMERIYSHLALIGQKDSLGSPLHRKSLDAFTDEMWRLYKAGKGDECLPLIEEAILGLDIFNKVLGIKKSFFGAPLDMQCHIPGLITLDGRFAYNMGAGLYFLKGEILRAAEGDTRRVLDAYVAAGQLAPNNLFGAGAFLWKDDQLGQNLAKDIQSYRENALYAGASPE